jgi:periplasmic protein TonB
MEIKKSNKASLEPQRTLFIEIGIVFAIALCLVAFEWTSRPVDNQLLSGNQSAEAEEEIIPITRQLQEQPPPPPPPQVIEVINIVQDDVDIDEIDFESMDADENTEFDFVPVSDQEEEQAEEEVFFIVEDMPMFQGGGKENFREYIAQNLQYPPIAAENGISGRVFVQFAVNAKGEVVDVIVVRGVDPALDKEAVRVVKSSPKWTPGKQRGRPVKVQFTFPIVFVLQ